MLTVFHTADWHLGQTLYGHSREQEQQRFLDWLVETLATAQADALLLAGDVFDVAHPSSIAQRQFYRFLLQAKQRLPGLQIVVIAGNHDSGARLAAPAQLLAALDIHVHGLYAGDSAQATAEATVVLRDATGTPAPAVLAIPFLRPQDLRSMNRLDSDQGLQYEAAIAEVYRNAVAHSANNSAIAGLPLLAMGHLHIAQARSSLHSERKLLLGKDEGIASAALPVEFDYVALGHLHLAQAFGAKQHIRYSGSPMAMASSEADYPHQLIQLQLDATGLQLQSVPIPQYSRFTQCNAADVEALWPMLSELPPADPTCDCYLEVQVQLQAPEPGLRQRVRAALRSHGYRLMPLRILGGTQRPLSEPATAVDASVLHRIAPLQVFTALYQSKFPGDLPDDLQAAFLALERQLAART